MIIHKSEGGRKSKQENVLKVKTRSKKKITETSVKNSEQEVNKKIHEKRRMKEEIT